MAFCRKCGEIIDDEAFICPKCGVAQRKFEKEVVDNGGFGFTALGCCIPLAGLVLYLLWKDEKPNTAKSIGVGLSVYLVFLVLYILVYFGFFGIAIFNL